MNAEFWAMQGDNSNTDVHMIPEVEYASHVRERGCKCIPRVEGVDDFKPPQIAIVWHYAMQSKIWVPRGVA